MRKFVIIYKTPDNSLSYIVTDDHLSTRDTLATYPFHTADCSPTTAVDEALTAFIKMQKCKIDEAQHNIDSISQLIPSQS
jgi:hypothetical protein